MKKLMICAQGYIRQMKLLDMGVLKLCLLALGVLLGISVPKRFKDYIAIAASSLFTGSYVLCMTGFLRFLLGCRQEPEAEQEILTVKF